MSKDNITSSTKSLRSAKNYGKSIRSKLLNIAKKEDVFYQTILTRYFQERLLYRMSQTKYRSNFYLKGGALMYAYEKFAARPTLDIDFLGNNISNERAAIVATFKEICSVPYEEDGITFDTDNITAQNITEFKDYHGVRLSIPVRMDTIAQVLTMDIGFGDVVTPSPIELDYPVLLEQLPSVNIMAYSLETVIAEKMHAIVDLADQSSRMKDYYDLYNILSKEKYDVDTLQEAIMRTFENRHTSYDADTMFFRKDFADNQQMQVRWQAFLRKIIKSESVTFADVVVYIQNELRPYWEKLSHE
jgi:predicted nucleotidyltransferase component of viral defense system